MDKSLDDLMRKTRTTTKANSVLNQIVILGFWRIGFCLCPNDGNTRLMKQRSAYCVVRWQRTIINDDRTTTRHSESTERRLNPKYIISSSISLLKSDKMSNCGPPVCLRSSAVYTREAGTWASTTAINADINFNRVTCLPGNAPQCKALRTPRRQ